MRVQSRVRGLEIVWAIIRDDRFESASSDLSETAPRMSISGFSPAVEKARHQEVSVSQRVGKNNMQVAFYSDSIVDPVLTGVGEMSAESGDVLPDVYSGTFSYQGNDYATRGMRVVLQRKLLSDLTATLDYAYGGALDLSRPDVQLQDAREWIRTERHQAVAAKFSGTVPKAKTHWIASYRYTGGRTLTPVDLFNSSAGQSDPYLNLFIRQPIPASFLAGHMEILMDLRNLLAQGYVPVMGRTDTLFISCNRRARYAAAWRSASRICLAIRRFAICILYACRGPPAIPRPDPFSTPSIKFGTDLSRALVYNAANLKWKSICCSRAWVCSSAAATQRRTVDETALIGGVCLLLSTAMLVGQTFRGTILGTVTDPSGAVVAGATVKVRNVATGLERTTATSADGSYAIPELPIGTYSVTVSQAASKLLLPVASKSMSLPNAVSMRALKTGQMARRSKSLARPPADRNHLERSRRCAHQPDR